MSGFPRNILIICYYCRFLCVVFFKWEFIENNDSNSLLIYASLSYIFVGDCKIYTDFFEVICQQYRKLTYHLIYLIVCKLDDVSSWIPGIKRHRIGINMA